MKLQAYREIIRKDYFKVGQDLPERIGRMMTIESAAELAREASKRPTVDWQEDERVLRTLAAALAAAVESHKR